MKSGFSCLVAMINDLWLLVSERSCDLPEKQTVRFLTTHNPWVTPLCSATPCKAGLAVALSAASIERVDPATMNSEQVERMNTLSGIQPSAKCSSDLSRPYVTHGCPTVAI